MARSKGDILEVCNAGLDPNGALAPVGKPVPFDPKAAHLLTRRPDGSWVRCATSFARRVAGMGYPVVQVHGLSNADKAIAIVPLPDGKAALASVSQRDWVTFGKPAIVVPAENPWSE